MMLSPKIKPEALVDSYVSRLDLARDPFDRNFKSNFFFPGGDRRKVLEQLVHYGRFSKQPVLLVGEVGSGKDRLVTEVAGELQAVMDCCRVSVELIDSAEAVLDALAERLSLKLDANHSLQSFLDALKFTLSDQEEVEPILIIIEKVQLLSIDVVEFLFELQSAGHGGVHMLLVADECTATLEVFCGEGAQALKLIQLRPLSQQESTEYVMTLLQSVGYAGDMPLTKEQWQELHESAQGNFYAIHEWMPELLAVKGVVGSKERAFGVPIAHVVAVSLLVAAITVAYLYQGDSDSKSDSNSRHENDLALVGAVKIEEEPKLAQHANAEGKLLTLAESEPEIEKVLPEKTPPMNLSSDPPAGKVVAGSKSKDIKTAVSDQLEKGAATVELASKSPSKASQMLEKVAVPDQLAVKKAAGQGQGRFSSQEQRVLSMPGSAYMLQLLGTRKEASAEGFTKRYAGKWPVDYLEVALKGKPWFVVLLGPYDSRSKAVAAIQKLPQSLQSQKPWARSVSGIQAEIRR